jgi:hypothetical protein
VVITVHEHDSNGGRYGGAWPVTAEQTTSDAEARGSCSPLSNADSPPAHCAAAYHTAAEETTAVT